MDELTKEGMEMFNHIGDEDWIDKMANPPKERKTRRNLRVHQYNEQLDILIRYSEQVIADSTLQVTHWTKKEQYFKANEARTVCTVHTMILASLKSIRNGGSAFPQEFTLIDDIQENEENPISKDYVI